LEIEHQTRFASGSRRKTPQASTGEGRRRRKMPTRPAADDIADCVLAAFDRLPNKFKPRILADGKRREWVPLAGMVLSRGEILVST
jgi:hypothetical protein